MESSGHGWKRPGAEQPQRGSIPKPQ
jgi:hypothetical protein